MIALGKGDMRCKSEHRIETSRLLWSPKAESRSQAGLSLPSLPASAD